MYGIYLSPLKNLPIKLFEIGLGCAMPYGAGVSVKMWKNWFQHKDFKLFVGEFSKDCAENFAKNEDGFYDLNGVQILLGDQGQEVD